MEHCADNGYDTTAFNKYFSEKFSNFPRVTNSFYVFR